MLRALVVALLLANGLFFAWTRGWLAPLWAAPSHGDREPARLAAQVRPELMVVMPADAASAALALGGSDFSPPAPPSAGGQGQRRLHFDVCRPGTHRLELALMRPWEGADAAVDRFTVTVCASAA